MIDKINKKTIDSFLENNHFLEKTELCHIMTKNGSDKGSNHNYTTFYNFIFSEIKNKSLNIFEVGLGTNNISIPSNMGSSVRPGASLRGWTEFFTKSNIFGADVDSGILFQEERIKTFYVDQNSEDTISKLWENENLNSIEFDIIIDDGLHEFEANRNFFNNSIHKLKNDGIYIIEDVSEVYLNEFNNWISENKDKYKLFEILTIPIPTQVQENNRVVLIKK
jgi:DNA-dependent RNA polymerase auxiliary subunit epsilon